MSYIVLHFSSLSNAIYIYYNNKEQIEQWVKGFATQGTNSDNLVVMGFEPKTFWSRIQYIYPTIPHCPVLVYARSVWMYPAHLPKHSIRFEP